jgi:hypothetical protein
MAGQAAQEVEAVAEKRPDYFDNYNCQANKDDDFAGLLVYIFGIKQNDFLNLLKLYSC